MRPKTEKYEGLVAAPLYHSLTVKKIEVHIYDLFARDVRNLNTDAILSEK
jgi:hypothetical protein